MARKREKDPPQATPDGRYIVMRNRLWRTSNPKLSDDERQTLVNDLMNARRSVRDAQRHGDRAGVAQARSSVDVAKIGLGERGPVWWDDGEPNYNRHLVHNSPYARWWLAVKRTAVCGGN